MINKKNILFLGPNNFESLIKKELPNYEVFHINDENSVLKIIKKINIILDASMKISFKESLLKEATDLELFITATTGFSHIDSKFLSSKNIPLKTLGDQQKFLNEITPAAELSWLLLMMCARKILSPIKDVKNGNWDRTKHSGMMLNGKTIGIIGLGRLGKWVAKYALSFGMKCYGFDPYSNEEIDGIQKTTLSQLLEKSDFITIHANYNPENGKILTKDLFEIIKKGAILINTSRGELIDEDALIESLNNGTLAAAGIDVLSGEPYIKDNKLFNLRNSQENLILTPHIGGYSEDVLKKVLKFTCKRIYKHFTND